MIYRPMKILKNKILFQGLWAQLTFLFGAMYRYPIIVFEGIEASGKSTNLEYICRYLKKINKKFVKIREPGGSKNSEILRKLILNKKSNLNQKTDLLLLLASRSENIDKIIKKKL